MTVEWVRDALIDANHGLYGVNQSFGVTLPLVACEDGLSLLFEVRAHTLRRQPGEVCFPGGGLEGEESPQQCAHREFCEELGLPATALTILSPLSPIHHRSHSLIHPFVGVVDRDALATASPNPQEVDHLFFVPLSHLMTTQPELHQYHWDAQVAAETLAALGVEANYFQRKTPVTIPIYRWEGHTIWGLTAHMVTDLVTKLIHHQPPNRRNL